MPGSPFFSPRSKAFPPPPPPSSAPAPPPRAAALEALREEMNHASGDGLFWTYHPHFEPQSAEHVIAKRIPLGLNTWQPQPRSTFLANPKALLVNGPSIEPLFCCLYLLDLDRGMRISECFYFDMIQPDVLEGPLVKEREQAEPLTKSMHALFTVQEPSERVVMILRVESVLQSDSNLDYYMRARPKQPPEVRLQQKKVKQSLATLSEFRQPFGWALLPLFKNGEDLLTSGILSTPRLFVEQESYSEEDFVRLCKEILENPNKTPKIFPNALFEIAIEPLSPQALPSNRYDPAGCPLKDTHLIAPLPPTMTGPVGSEVPMIRHVADFRSKDMPVFPDLQFVNLLYLYPISYAFAKTKHVACKMELRMEKKRDPEMPPTARVSTGGSNPLKMIFQKSNSAAQANSCITQIQHHKKGSPYDEVKILMPLDLTPDFHIFFSFFSVAKKNGKRVLLGYAALPLTDATGKLIHNGVHSLPVTESLQREYLEEVRNTDETQPPPKEGGSLFSAAPKVFDVRVHFSTTIFNQNVQLHSFFHALPNDKELIGAGKERGDVLIQQAIEHITQVPTPACVRFLPALLHRLLLMMTTRELTRDMLLVGLITLLHRVTGSEELSERIPVVHTYVIHKFENVPGAAPLFTFLPDVWAKAFRENYGPKSFNVSMALTHAWFFFDILAKSLMLVAAEQGKIDDLVADDFLTRFSELLKLFVSLIRNHKTHGLSLLKRLALNIGLFFTDMFTVLPHQLVLSLLESFLIDIGGADPGVIDLKFTMYTILLDFTFFWDIDGVFSPPVELTIGLDLVSQAQNRHKLSNLFVSDLVKILQLSEADTTQTHLKDKVVNVLRFCLTKIDHDKNWLSYKSRIAFALFPLIVAVVEEPRLTGDLGDVPLRNFLVCLLWILKHQELKYLRHWWTSIKFQTLIDFFALLKTALDLFQYKGVKDRSTFAESILAPEVLSFAHQFEELAESLKPIDEAPPSMLSPSSVSMSMMSRDASSSSFYPRPTSSGPSLRQLRMQLKVQTGTTQTRLRGMSAAKLENAEQEKSPIYADSFLQQVKCEAALSRHVGRLVLFLWTNIWADYLETQASPATADKHLAEHAKEWVQQVEGYNAKMRAAFNPKALQAAKIAYQTKQSQDAKKLTYEFAVLLAQSAAPLHRSQALALLDRLAQHGFQKGDCVAHMALIHFSCDRPAQTIQSATEALALFERSKVESSLKSQLQEIFKWAKAVPERLEYQPTTPHLSMSDRASLLERSLELLAAFILKPQTSRLLLATFGCLDNFIGLYGETFIQSPSIYQKPFSLLVGSVLRVCAYSNESVRSRALGLLRQCVLTNYFLKHNVDVMKLSLTMCLAEFVESLGPSEEELMASSIDRMLEPPNELPIDPVQTREMKGLKDRLKTILADSIAIARQMRLGENADRATCELMLVQVALAFNHIPSAELAWVNRLCEHHMKLENFAEAGQCCLLIADLQERQLQAAGSGSEMFQVATVMGALEKTCEILLRAEYYEQAAEVYQRLLRCYESNRLYSRMAQSHKALSGVYSKIAECEDQETRNFGTYFRVRFYGPAFGPSLDGREFVYKYPKLTRLPNVTNSLQRIYSEQLSASVTIFTGAKDRTKEEIQDKPCIQVTFVTPYFEGDDTPGWLDHLLAPPDSTYIPHRVRQHFIERNTNLKCFQYSTPLDKASEKTVEVYKKKTRLFTADAFPFMSTAVEVVRREQVVISPIESATEDVDERVEKLLGIICARQVNHKELNIFLAGSVATQVHGGAKELIDGFLSKEEPLKEAFDHQEALKRSMRRFLVACEMALETNRKLCERNAEDEKQFAFHKDLETKFHEMCDVVGPIIAESGAWTWNGAKHLKDRLGYQIHTPRLRQSNFRMTRSPKMANVMATHEEDM